MNNMNRKVDSYLSKAKKWREEMEVLRGILLDCQLTEEWKWNKPCYTFRESNIVVLLGLKEHCALILCKGSLLKDPEGILIKPGENTQAARQMRFTSATQIVRMKHVLKAYLLEAIEAEKAGLKVNFKAIAELTYPEEFQKQLDGDPGFKAAFDALTPGRRRAYNMYFSAPKQPKTRALRVEKCKPQILNGKGLNDQYIREKAK